MSTRLSASEKALWSAAEKGDLLDLRTLSATSDPPEKGYEWDQRRTIRADVVRELLIGGSEATQIRALRIQGAHIDGELDLRAATFRFPVVLQDCYFSNRITLAEASAQSLSLAGSYVLRALHARQLVTRGNLDLGDGFNAQGIVDLRGARIGGTLDCAGGHFRSTHGRGKRAGIAYGPALEASGISVGLDVYLSGGFDADGKVSMFGAEIGGSFSCVDGRFRSSQGEALDATGASVKRGVVFGGTFRAEGEVALKRAEIRGPLVFGGEFINPTGVALSLEQISAQLDLLCGEGFRAEGEVSMHGAQIGGSFVCRGGTFRAPGRVAIDAERVSIKHSALLHRGFSAEGEVRLLGAEVSGQLVLGGRFSKNEGIAVVGESMRITHDVICEKDLSADGTFDLIGTRVGNRLVFDGGRFSRPSDYAIQLRDVAVAGTLSLRPAELEGNIDLRNARVDSFIDDPTTWPSALRLEGFRYDTIHPSGPKDRLVWLKRNEAGFVPSLYDQLEAFYKRAGRDDDARQVGMEKQRRRRAQLNPAGKLANAVLEITVGYGYRTWLAAVWLGLLLVLGTVVFGEAYPNDLTAARESGQPEFQATIYTLDLLLPIAGLRQRDLWIPHGSMHWWVVGFTLAGWVLATAVALSLSGLLKRE